MEWCCASSMGERVVPKNQEVSESFPSPESWLHKWGRTEPENFSFPNKSGSFVMDNNNFNGGILSDEAEMDSSTYDKDWSRSGGGASQESSFQQTLDYQLLSLAGFESTDDLYLSSLMEDIPGNEEFYNSYSMDPEMQEDMLDCDTISGDLVLNKNNTSSDSHSMGSSKYLKTHAFSPSSDQDKGHISAQNCPSVKGLVSSGHNDSNEQVNEETCLEESVLEQLGMVMSQMTEKTRLCFRDGLYRLANNSRQHGAIHNPNGFDLLGTPTWTEQEDKLRLEGKQTRESETNTIDRTIANLLFNKMDTNPNGFPVPASTSSQEESHQTGLPNCSSSLPHYTSFSSENDVSIFSQGMSPTRVVPNLAFSQNPA